jgi:LmbE family N-acetylglucosaminyl deacetylase
MKKLLVLLILIFLVSSKAVLSASANQSFARTLARQSDEPRGIGGLAQSLKELSNPYSLLSVATTLNDVDFPALAYYQQKLGAHIAIVLATRGERAELNLSASSTEDLAVEVTRKALQAAQAIDADLYFLNLPDAGSANTAEEAFAVWGDEEAAKKMIQAIRWIRPDAIISNHDGKAGDGQQQAVGRLLVEAFDSAADTKTATGADSEPWQVKRFFLRTGENSAEVVVNGNEFDSLRGKTYAQAAWLDPANLPHAPSTPKSFYRLALSAAGDQRQGRQTFFDGFTLPEKLRLSVAPPIVGSLSLMEALTLPEKLVEALTEKLIEKRAEGSVATLRARYGKEYFRVLRFTSNLERAIALALGIRCELTLPDKIIAQGEPLQAQITFHNNSQNSLSMVFHTPVSLPVAGKNISYKTSEVISVAPFHTVSQEITYETAKDAPLTLPHVDHLYEEKYYPASALRFSRQPFGNLLFASAEVNLGQTTISLPVIQRFDVARPFEISVTPGFAFVKDWADQRDIEVVARIRKRQRGAFTGALWIVPMALQSENYEPLPLRFTTEDEEALVKLKLKLPIMRPPLSPDILIELRRDKPAAPVALASMKIPVKLLECQVTEGTRVGFIANRASTLAQSLAVLAVESTALSVEEVSTNEHGVKAGEPINQTCADLSRFDSILVDALAYSGDANLLAKNQCLLDYARRGGNLVVLYQRPGFWSSVFNPNPFAPFSIRLSKEKIANQNAVFKILNAEHPLMSKPNKIVEKDFQGWSKSLALYLPKEWSSDYQALIELSNANGEAQKGSLLFAPYGEGSYAYVSLDFQGQWLGANAGAFKLLANLISLPKVRKEQGHKQ